MRIATTLLSLALGANAVLASSWFSNAAYNKWHETELERWLSDHDVPYPTPADRKELEKLVQKNWDVYVVSPYSNWDTAKMNEYLKQKGIETKDSAAASKDSLLSQVRSNWYETEDKTQSAWGNVKDWILDTWTDSQLKSFCDHHGIPGMSSSAILRFEMNYVLTRFSFSTPEARHHPREGTQRIPDSRRKSWRDRIISRKLAVRDLER